MKKIIQLILFLVFAIFSAWLVSCGDDKVDSTSIFPDDTTYNKLDKWIRTNVTDAYNVEVKYRLDDSETNMNYNLVPAEIEKAYIMTRAMKYLWFEAYDEAVTRTNEALGINVPGINFMRANSPKLILLIGSPAYNADGTYLLGTAEGGQKVTMYKINDLDVNHINGTKLNADYFQTMHHEFGHILNQKKNYSIEFQQVTEKDYVTGSWSASENTLAKAYELGFVSRYSRSSHEEDFVEIYSIYICSTEAQWNDILTKAGDSGAPIIAKKLEIVKEYMLKKWSIDMDLMREIINRRNEQVKSLDMDYNNLRE